MVYFNETMQFDAKILNYSRSGIYLEAGQAIKPETTVFIRLEILLSGSWGSSDHGLVAYPCARRSQMVQRVG
jgi:hypothetical protein